MKIRIAESIRIEEQLSSKVENTTEALRKVQSEINDFTALRFGGETSDSIRSYFGEVHLPLIKSLIQAGEGLDQSYKKMMQRFSAQVDSSSHAVIRSEHLDEVHKDLQRLKSHFDQIHHQLSTDVRSAGDISSFHIPSAARMDEAVERQKHEVSRLKDHFSTFGSADYAGNITPLLSAIGHAMSKIKKDYTPHFGEGSFYTAGSFASSDIGEELVRRTKVVAKKSVQSEPKQELSEDPGQLTINAASAVTAGLPALIARTKGLKMKRAGKYIRITGGKKNLKLFFDRWGKSKTFSNFNVSLSNGQNVSVGRRVIDGKSVMSRQGRHLISESSAVRNYLTKNKLKVFGREFKSNLNDLWNFVSKDSWSKVGHVGKFGKSLGVAGLGFTVYSDINAYRNEKMSVEKAAKISGDIAVDTTTGAGAVAAGAAVGSFFAPPIGTAVGAGAGFLANTALNVKFIKGKSIVDWSKIGMHKLGQGIASWFDNH
ncbi:T7SS effector LXG polymorphic toxin [Sporolactobacillus sp. Y61]|uniref:T7SS effector LXG polymorphic toxin n=1 Tax=Sporolactobacillus sp. Y61 TaxID=3160863 RepID=A0AAU8II14_9BACL